MAKRTSQSQLFDELCAVRKDPAATAAREALRSGLGSGANFIVEKAAGIIGELKLAGYSPQLLAAFDRLMKGEDPRCAARIAVLRALLDNDPGREAEPAFRKGLRHFQFDGPLGADSAGPLRGYCGLGLLAIGSPDALVALTDLLADPEPPARIAAARGLASAGREYALLLLRLRLLVDDTSTDVLGECMTGLLRLDPEQSLPLVSRFLDDDAGEVRDTAALALGESRLPAALAPLRDAYRRQREQDSRRAILIAAGLLRGQEAVDWLVSVVENGHAPDSSAALESLRVHRRDAALVARVRSIAASRKLAPLQRELDKHWRE